MMILTAAVVLVALAFPAAGGTMFELSSPAFKDSTTIPKKYTCDGKDVSPPLAWKDYPAGTAAIAVIMEDPDAPVGLWIHWVHYDVPAANGALAEGQPPIGFLPDGSKQGVSWGVTKFEKTGWGGPCPPPGKPHRYVFRAYALSSLTGLAPGATKDQLLEAIKGKTLARAELTGLYGR
jgi:Raf kinase inhibitor-like YbhB/YbcL family protein